MIVLCNMNGNLGIWILLCSVNTGKITLFICVYFYEFILQNVFDSDLVVLKLASSHGLSQANHTLGLRYNTVKCISNSFMIIFLL